MKSSLTHQFAIGAILLIAAIGASVSAGPSFTFTGLSNNSAHDTLTGQTQFSVKIDDAGPGQVLFTFLNSGPDPSSITQMYFDNGPAGSGALASIDGFEHSNPASTFSVGATPSNLSGWAELDPTFQATEGLTASADKPQPHNGVNPGQSLGMLTTLASSYTFTDVLEQIYSGSLRIGIHAQGFEGGGSESFVLSQPPIVPTPGSLLLATIGLGVLRTLQYRRRFA